MTYATRLVDGARRVAYGVVDRITRGVIVRTVFGSPIRRVGFVAALTLVAACQPAITLPATGEKPVPCPQGTYLVAEQALSPFTLPALGVVQLAPQAGGNLTLSVLAESWTVAGSQNMGIRVEAPFGVLDGVVSVNVDAAGTWQQASSSTLDFQVDQVSGSAAFTGTFAGIPVTRTVSLADVGADKVFGFSGSADFACGGDPSLTLTFSSISLQLNRA